MAQSKSKSKSKFYIINVEGCVEPLAIGPFLSVKKRDKTARYIHDEQSEEDAIFWAEVTFDGILKVGAYANAFFNKTVKEARREETVAAMLVAAVSEGGGLRDAAAVRAGRLVATRWGAAGIRALEAAFPRIEGADDARLHYLALLAASPHRG